MNIRTTFVSLALAAGLAAAMPAGAQAGSYVYGFSPRTGDSWMDSQLGDMNRDARNHGDGFMHDVVFSFGAPRVLVRDLYYDRRWAPGDIYYACALARALHRPCVEIVDVYERDHGRGWGNIAKSLGIKPGSAEFHALKGNVGKSNGKFKAYPVNGNNGNASNKGNSGNTPASHGNSGKPKSNGNNGNGNKGGNKK